MKSTANEKHKRLSHHSHSYPQLESAVSATALGLVAPLKGVRKWLDHYQNKHTETITRLTCAIQETGLFQSLKNLSKNTTLRTAVIMTLCLFLSPQLGLSSVVEIDLNHIKQIESSGNPLAVSGAGCRGLYQISDITRREYNNFLNEFVTPDDLFNPQINEQIADWYLHVRIPQMLRYFKKPLTVENVLISYNAGISYVTKGKPLPTETKKYLKKYNKLEGK